MKRLWILLLALVVACDPAASSTVSDAGSDAPVARLGTLDATLEGHKLGAGPTSVALRYIAQSGATDGQVATWTGGIWAPASLPATGGGSLDAATLAPIVGNGTAASPIALERLDGGGVGKPLEWAGDAWVPTAPNVGSVVGSAPVSCMNSVGVVTCGLTGTGYAASVTGTNGVSCSPTTGSASCGLSAPVSVANGGTGTVTAPSSTQVLVAQSSSAYAPETLSGDCTLSSSGVVTCDHLGGGAISYLASAGAFSGPVLGWGATATGPLVGQNAQTTDVAPPPFSITASSAFPGASTHLRGGDVALYGGAGATTGGLSGDVTVNFVTPSSGTNVTPFGRLKVTLDGTTVFAVGSDPFWGPALFFGDPSTTNAAMYSPNSNTTNLAAGTTAGVIIGGSAFAVHALGSSTETVIGSEYNFALTTNSLGGSYGGGQGVVNLAPATTNPTGTTTGSVFYSDNSTGDFGVKAPAGTSAAIDVGASAFTANVPLDLPSGGPLTIANCNGGTTTATALQSSGLLFVATCTTGSTASTVKSAYGPVGGVLWFVRNTSGVSLTFEFSSGSGVSVATGTSALITSNGTNALVLMAGT